MAEIIGAIVMVVLVALAIYLSLKYFRKIRRREAIPVVNPAWTANMHPTTGIELERPNQGR
jgi:hypothetical protein